MESLPEASDYNQQPNNFRATILLLTKILNHRISQTRKVYYPINYVYSSSKFWTLKWGKIFMLVCKLEERKLSNISLVEPRPVKWNLRLSAKFQKVFISSKLSFGLRSNSSRAHRHDMVLSLQSFEEFWDKQQQAKLQKYSILPWCLEELNKKEYS